MSTLTFPPGGPIASLELAELVAGEWRSPAITLPSPSLNPNDGTRLGAQVASSPASIERALTAADAAHESGVWQDLAPKTRAEHLRAIAACLEARTAELAYADALTTGVVHKTTALLAMIPARAFTAAAELALSHAEPARLPGPHGDLEVLRLPRGPAVVISPWNAPAPIAAHKLASALAAGCPVIFKPSELAPASCQIIAEAIAAADLPPGVFQLVHGGAAVGDALVADARVAAVSFTGGVEGGRAVGRRSAEHIRPVQLELGGLNSVIVLAGADLEAAARGIVTGLTTLNGQWCRAVGRIFVARSVAKALFERTSALLGEVRVGHSLDPHSQMGPIANAAQRQRIELALTDLATAGAVVHRTAPLPALAGHFVAPTLVTGLAADQAEDEIFGPVATWHEFDGVDEALAATRRSRHGLAAYVFGPAAEAWAVGRRVHAGTVKLNAITLFALSQSAPRPAWGLSGLVDEGTVETFEFFRGTRVIGAGAEVK